MTKVEKIKKIISETDINFSPYYDVIAKLIRERKYTKGIEIGVFCGGHAKAILDNSDLKLLVGVDPYKFYSPGMPGFEDQKDFDILYALTKSRLSYKERYQHIRETSDVAYEKYLKKHTEQYNFVFIDGLHTYEQCKNDLENYSKLIKQGGVIAGHDIDHPTFPLLTKAIEEFSKKHNAKVVRKAFHSWYIDKTWSENDKEEIVFKENDYLTMYPDVAKAVARGRFKTGYDHYLRYGKREGRKCNLIDNISELADEVTPGLGVHLDSWSNTLTLKGYKEKPRVLNELNMVDVPEEFKQVQNIEYPEGNKIPFERYFEECFKEERPDTLRKYLPIHWTSYYVNNKYGSDKVAIKKLQNFIDTLPEDEQYFTLLQYDDGILNDVSKLDLLVYSMGCNKPGYYPTPLISQPLCCNPIEKHEKDLLYSFVGANTHPIRKELVKELGGKKEGIISLENMSHDKYLDILKRSVFSICPRGYGVTSFRMFEGMAFNSIPVYVSDNFWEPFNIPFTEYGIKITSKQIKDIPEILKSVDVKKMQEKGEYYFKEFFVYSSCFNNIINTLL